MTLEAQGSNIHLQSQGILIFFFFFLRYVNFNFVEGNGELSKEPGESMRILFLITTWFGELQYIYMALQMI